MQKRKANRSDDRRIGLRTPARHAQLDVCFRPEAAYLADGNEGVQSIAGKVVYVENLGAEVFVHVGIDGVPQPAIIRRPVIDTGGSRQVGFSEETYSSLLQD